MPPVPSRPALAALGLAALLVTAGCLSTASASSAAPETVAQTGEQIRSGGAGAAPVAADEDDSAAPAVTPTPTETPTPTATPEPPSSAADLEATFESRMTALTSFTATRSQTTTLDNQTSSMTTDMWVQLSTGEYRTEVVAPEERAGNAVVAGTDTVWVYDEARNEVTTYNRSSYGTANASTSVVTGLATGYDVTDYERTTVDGQETYRVTLTPETDTGASAETSATAWLDTETYFPVTVEQSYEFDNTSVSTQTHYENVTLNATIPDERFRFDPPANATVESVDLPETRTFDSLESMRESVDETVPDPEVPEEFTFQQGTVVEYNHTTLSLTYENETSRIGVSKLSGERALGGGENVTVGDHDAHLRSYGETTMVTWTCDGWTYSVSGTVDRAELLDIARSVECA
jgi:outer membrane lipoprotein-sorting protein